MKSKTIITSIIGAASLIGGEAIAQTTTKDAMIVSYNEDTKIAHMRDLTTGEVVESLPTERITPGDLVRFDKLSDNKGIVIASQNVDFTSTGFFHS
ncbi:MAG: hypothetical protein K0S44_1772 [Bacteroidetes bacterium]|jgi:hypothetical protein|nr:hypothetical protein [Bacteroidota bacterium]